MDISTKELRIGFRLGIYEFDKIQEWVNHKINQSEKPNDILLSLAFAKKDESHKIFSLLSSMPNSEEDDSALIKVLGDIPEITLADLGFCQNLAKNLYNYWADNDYTVNDKLIGIWDFDDGFDCAVQGIGDSVDT